MHALFGDVVAVAATPTGSVSIPWGDWLILLLNQLAPIIIAAIVALVTWICRKLPANVAAIVKETITQNKIERAVSYGLAQTTGALKGKTLTADHVDAILSAAVAYASAFFPQLLEELGDRFRPMALAKISQLGAVEDVSPATAPLPSTPVSKPFVEVPK